MRAEWFLDHGVHDQAGDERAVGINTNPLDPRWIEFNERYNDFAAGYGGRPLFTQTLQLNRDIVYRSLGPAWEKFVALRAQADPDDRFLNEYFRDLI